MQITQAEYEEFVRKGLFPKAPVPNITGSRTTGTTAKGNQVIRIILPGTPIGKPRMTLRDKWAKRPAVVKYRDWCDRLRALAGTIPPAGLIYELNWVAVFEPPKSWAKKERCSALGTLHRMKPDRDNIDKAVLDCLWESDSAIAQGRIAKVWGFEPRLELEMILVP